MCWYHLRKKEEKQNYNFRLQIADLRFMTNRIEKVNSLLEREIGKIILKDFDFFDAVITLTHVEATANLIEAKVYISVLPEVKNDKVVRLLNKEVYSIQRKINKMLNMRPIPRIKFVKDNVIAEAAKIEGILETLKKEGK